jgi:XTP/dITP diphosphohydrolase
MTPQKHISCIVLASNNEGKVKEFNEILRDFHISIVPQSDLGVTEIEETGLTFVENAILKARNASTHTGLPALADDSGIEVDALNGAPGVFSARFSAPHANARNNRLKLLQEMIAYADSERAARYTCVLVLLRHAQDPSPIICQGTWEGKVLFEERGHGGFGYDPIFFLPSHGCTAAELSSAEKNKISHRAQAVAKLLDALRQEEVFFPSPASRESIK